MQTALTQLNEANRLVTESFGRQPEKALGKLYAACDIFRRLGRWAEYYNARRMISELNLKISNDQNL